jgi:DNA (cytosine-5)-methyltransferase 1
MAAYYNEIDAGAAQWLRNLIAAGLIAPGDVDERSISDVRADDLVGYSQCHFFAGIGGWSYALRLAGWPDDRPVWTGSCPCQPFSSAGRGGGFADERHLWPEFFRLIRECRPPVVFGEQVAFEAGWTWFASVRADVEGGGYAGAAVELCAAGVGAPHARQRLYWVADRPREGLEGYAGHVGDLDEPGWLGACAPRPRDDAGFWSRVAPMLCRDGRSRPVPVADGLPAGMAGGVRGDASTYARERASVVRNDALRGMGNAIVPQVAAAFVGAWLEERCSGGESR